MNKGKRISAAIGMVLVASTAVAEESYLDDYSGSYMCRPIGTTGAVYEPETKAWEAVTFNANKWQHFVKVTSPEDQAEGNASRPPYRKYSIHVTRADIPGSKPELCMGEPPVGKNYGPTYVYTETASCTLWYNNSIIEDATFFLNFSQLRYQMTAQGSFLRGKDTATDKDVTGPFVQFGECSKLD